MDFKHCRHTGDKNVSYVKRSSRFPVQSHIIAEKCVSPNAIYVSIEKRDD